MKKVLFLFAALCFGTAVVSCTDAKTGGNAAAEEVDAAAEEAVQAYEAWFVKYDSLVTKSQAGEDVLDALLEVQLTEGVAVTEKLLATESKRNADQKARVKAIEAKADSIKQIVMGN